MASNNLQVLQQPISNMMVEVEPPNDPTLGFKFEDEVALHAMLKLKERQALAREVKFAKGFDDIVLINNFNNGGKSQEYYLYQLKHKDIERSILWEDFLDLFSLEKHFRSYLKIKEEFSIYLSQNNLKETNNKIKALVFMTNLGFDASVTSSSGTSNHQQNNNNTANNAASDYLDRIFGEYLSWQGGKKKNSKGSKQHAGTSQQTETAQTPRPSHAVTKDDLALYFKSAPAIGAPDNVLMGKRYKFAMRGVTAVKDALSNRKETQPLSDFKLFLKMLVFEVATPNLTMLKTINPALLKLFFPFHWSNERESSCCCEDIKQNVLQHLKPSIEGASRERYAKWATIVDRQSGFNEMRLSFKEKMPLGSITGYEVGALKYLYKELKFEAINEGSKHLPLPWAWLFNEMPNYTPSLPIFLISSEKSNSTITTLKIFKAAQQTKSGDGYSMQHKTLIVQVQDNNGTENINEYLKNLSRQVQPFTEIKRERFYFVIQVSPFFGPVDEAKGNVIKTLIQKLTTLKELRNWIQFVVVTQQPVQDDANETTTDVVSIQDPPLKWSDLTEETKNYLYEKTLFLYGNGKVLSSSEASSLDNEINNAEEAAKRIKINEQKCWKTSLKALGLDKESIGDWLDPLSLGELITHNKERPPLCLGLPEYDADLDAMYITRQVKFPFVRLNGMNEELQKRIVFDEEEFNKKIARDKTKTYHLLERLEPSSHNSDIKWLKSNGKAFEELEPHVIKSKDSNWCFPELGLLDGTHFGSTGLADNKLTIVVDLPGKGKTCLLTSLTNRYLKQQSAKEQLDYLMLRINLLEVKASAWDSEKIGLLENEMAAVTYLLNNIFSSENLNVLDATILKQMCLNSSTASVFVLLDGFDEINEHQRSITYKLIDQLLLGTKGIKRIILTSRPDNGLEVKLQAHFQQFPLHMANFTEQDQIDFLVNRWSMKLYQEETTAEKRGSNDEEIVNETRIYAEELVKYSQKALADEDRSFLDIPLQCLIVSECFFKNLKQYLTECQDSSSRDSRNLPTFQDEHFQLLHLYDNFYGTKIDILFQEKAKFSPGNDAASFVKEDYKEGNCSNAMMRLSVFQMMTDIKDAETMCRTSWKTYKNSKYVQDLKRGSKLGLIQNIDENQLAIENLDAPHVKFIHRTFAEYFIASYFIQSFTQADSELLDRRAFYFSEILDATYKIITEKIFVYTEYAGIVRFFERMLEKHIPPVPAISEESLFTKNNREDVMKEWPVISHEQFNRFVARTLASECSKVFKKWTKEKIDQFDSSNLLNNNIRVLREKQEKDPKGTTLFSLLTSDTKNKSPNVITLLIQCIKEYASRPPDVSDDEREALAHCFTLILLTWVNNELNDSYDRRHTALLMQWYDPAKELSNEQNLIVSKWFLKIVHYYVTEGKSHHSYYAVLGVGFFRMKQHHRHCLLNFQEHVKTLVKTIFDISRNDTTANRFFGIGHDELTDDAKTAEEKSLQFVSVLFLTTLISPYDDSLLKLQVNWFRAQLGTFIKCNGTLKEFNPFAIIATTDYLMTNINKRVAELSPSAASAANDLMKMKETIVASALNYFNDVLPFLARSSYYVYNHVCNHGEEREMPLSSPRSSHLSRGERKKTRGNIRREKCNIILLLWHVALSDKIISYLHDEQCQRQAFLNLHFTAIGRWSLLAFADANCCQLSRRFDKSELVIYFPSEMYESGKTMERFEEWSNQTLKIVWQEKNEREFIAFLFKNEMKLSGIPISKYNRQNKFSLRALPCLLFLDTVDPYIPNQLSQDGLGYLEETLKNIYLPEANKKSLWDNIMQEDIPSCDLRTCKHKIQEQVKMLKEKIEKRKENF